MGTTVTAAALVDDFLFFAQVGDSRAYLLRDKRLHALTRDQSMAEGLVIPTTLQGSGLAFLSMGFDIKGPTYVNDTIHVEIEVTEIKPTSKDPARALVRTTNDVKNQKGETVGVESYTGFGYRRDTADAKRSAS